MIVLLLLRAISASTYTLGKAGLSYAEPLFFLGSRSFLGAFGLLAYHFLMKGIPKINREDWHLFLQQGFFQIFLGVGPAYIAFQYMQSSKWALLYTITPFFTAIFSYFVFNERVTLKKVLGFCIAFGGLLPILMISAPAELTDFFGFSWPEIITLTAAASYGYGWVIARKLIKKGCYDSSLINGSSLFIGGSLVMISSLCLESWQPLPVSNVSKLVPILLTIGCIYSCGLYLYTWLLNWYTATFLMFVTFIDPLYVALYGFLFLDESVGWHFFTSAAAVFIGLYLFYREDLRQGYSS